MLRRDRLIFLIGLIAVTGLAWAWLLMGAGMGMSAFEMTAMAGMDGWLMPPAEWTAGYALIMASMWTVMMAAMMLPSALPVLLLHLKLHKRAGETAWFALGYVAAWAGFSLLAAGLQWALETARLMSPMLETTNVWLGAAILVAAGLWQLTPLKAVCLRHCRSPLGFLMGRWRTGAAGAFRSGLEHGVYCLGCCWFLMALLFVGGVMNIYWIVGLTVFVLLEKTAPFGHLLGRVAGVALIVCGLALPVL